MHLHHPGGQQVGAQQRAGPVGEEGVGHLPSWEEEEEGHLPSWEEGAGHHPLREEGEEVEHHP